MNSQFLLWCLAWFGAITGGLSWLWLWMKKGKGS